MNKNTINIENALKMPRLTIDSYTKDDKEIPGVKRMFDIALELKDSVMQHGGPGIGKSQGVMQWNQEKVIEYEERIKQGEKIKPWNPKVCDVRLSMKEPVDMIGIPIISKDDKGNTTTVWATPSIWPKEDDGFSGGTIHLDELNQGQPAILNAAFQLIQDRALGEYKVPDGYIIIASANPSVYNSTVSELPLPLSNRFTHFNIKVDFDSWLNYRINNNGNADVIAFLKTQDSSLLFNERDIQEKIGEESDLFTDIIVTPRSWEIVERVLALPDGNKSTGGFTKEEKRLYITGRLGITLTSRLFTFLEEKEKYQDYHEIIQKGEKFKSEDANQFWAVQLSCIAAIRNTEDDNTCRKYVLNFLKATEQLNNTPYKVINLLALVKLKRLAGKLNLFNPATDAAELIKLTANALYS